MYCFLSSIFVPVDLSSMENMIPIKTSCTVAQGNCECFDHLTDEQNRLIEENQVTIEYKKGEIITKQGSFTSHVLLIEDGLVKVYYEGRNESLILRISPPGCLIGLTSVPNNSNVFHFSSAAYVNTTAKLIDINIIRKFILENPKFANSIITILSENAIQKNNRFFCLTQKQSYGKLADLLLCLAGNIFKDNSFDLLLTRKELAELAGMSTESVIRTLKLFQDDGLIKNTGKSFHIIDPEGLYKISELG